MSEKEKGFVNAFDIDNGLVTITYRNGGQDIASESFDIQKIKDSPIFNQFLCQAVATLLSARRSQWSGVEKLELMVETYQDWEVGTWAPERQGGVRVISADIEAVAVVTGQGIEAARASWKALSSAQQVELMTTEKFAEALEKVRASRKVSEDSLDLSTFIS